MLHPRRASAVFVAALAATSLGGWRLGLARAGDGPDGPAVRVTSVIDGDTIEVVLAGRPDRVRLLGVDTPETVDPHRPVGCYGPEASAFTKQHLAGRTVRLRFDRQRRDRYGRLLAYVYLRGRFVNASLIELGYARTLSVPPNTAHAAELASLERRAALDGRGLWGACST